MWYEEIHYAAVTYGLRTIWSQIERDEMKEQSAASDFRLTDV